jgi:hypothetical protein
MDLAEIFGSVLVGPQQRSGQGFSPANPGEKTSDQQL